MVEAKDFDKLLEAVVALSLRVTAVERVLQSEGVITRERYVEELQNCTDDATAIMKAMTSEDKILS